MPGMTRWNTKYGTQLATRVPPDRQKQIEQICRETNHSVGEILRVAIELLLCRGVDVATWFCSLPKSTLNDRDLLDLLRTLPDAKDIADYIATGRKPGAAKRSRRAQDGA